MGQQTVLIAQTIADEREVAMIRGLARSRRGHAAPAQHSTGGTMLEAWRELVRFR